MKDKYTKFFSSTFLFKGIEPGIITELLNGIQPEISHYCKNEEIISPENYGQKIGFIVSGQCIVKRKSGDSIIPLNILKEYESFGISTLFSDGNRLHTIVSSKGESKIIFLSKDDILKLTNECHDVSINIIKFMTKKINFLNEKVAAFSSCTVEEKLANYILELGRKYNSNEFEFNKNKSSEALNCGRASLYRAIENLASDGYISVINKKLYIIDRDGLERKTK